MKRSAGWFLALLIGLFTAHAQEFAIDWWTLDGGGGTSTGGIFAITGTVGQPDPGTQAGGGYALVGGFWSILAAVSTPFLEITRTNGWVIVSWLRPATGYELDYTATFNNYPTIAWSRVDPSNYLTNATHISVVRPASDATGFYRLRK